MVTLLVSALFAGVFVFAAWAMFVTIAPEFGRIGFLLRHGPLLDAPLPQPRLSAPRRPSALRPVSSARRREVA